MAKAQQLFSTHSFGVKDPGRRKTACADGLPPANFGLDTANFLLECDFTAA